MMEYATFNKKLIDACNLEIETLPSKGFGLCLFNLMNDKLMQVMELAH